METASRLEALRSMLGRNPADSFARYAVAMELARRGDLADAVEEYRSVLAADRNYAAAYFHGGQALEKLGRLEEARELYEQGISVTAGTGDGHTRSELQAALDMLPL